MSKNRAPHPPDETADELRAALRRNHPDLTDAELDVLLVGEPKKRRRGYAPDWRWTAGIKGPTASGIATKGAGRGGWRGRRR